MFGRGVGDGLVRLMWWTVVLDAPSLLGLVGRLLCEEIARPSSYQPFHVSLGEVAGFYVMDRICLRRQHGVHGRCRDLVRECV